MYQLHKLIWCIAIFPYVAFGAEKENQTTPQMLCPYGYWPAMVNTTSGIHGSERTFELPYTPDIEEPICQFCPNVGCYIVRQLIIPKVNKSKKRPMRMTTVPITTTPETVYDAESTESLLEHLNVTEPTDVNRTTTEPEPECKFYMSCDYWNSLPPPVDIVSYLDCVMIGKKGEFYLFIYEPRFQEHSLPTVDCISPDFLAWIQNGSNILGLELGFRMKKIPPFLFRYHQRIMQLTQYICIDGSALENKSIPFEDTERFASNKLTQVVFRTQSLIRDRRPPKAPDSHYTAGFESDEEIEACPHIVQHKPANITPHTDCQFSPGALPTTSDRVDPEIARSRCPFRSIPKSDKKNFRRRSSSTGREEELKIPLPVLNACLLVLVLVLTAGIIIAFCVMNGAQLALCKTRGRKRREREAAIQAELAEKAAKEAAAVAAKQAENNPSLAWHPIYGRYGVVPPTMGGAFGAFAARPTDFPSGQPMMVNQANAHRA
ncbi:unnamed protein product [Calicophoron daubneyi]|uniref:Uncharacterized protein n=1 Tax=Calicophoron daubneyi TaxID=300641 RepID=A0AAV2T1G0_CALDB